MSKIKVIDQRGDKYNPNLAIGWPRDNRIQVSGLSGPGINPDCPAEYDAGVRRVRAYARGRTDCVLVLHNYAIDLFAAEPGLEPMFRGGGVQTV